MMHIVWHGAVDASSYPWKVFMHISWHALDGTCSHPRKVLVDVVWHALEQHVLAPHQNDDDALLLARSAQRVLAPQDSADAPFPARS